VSIYVENLSYQVTQEDITALFAEYGTVKSVQLPTDPQTGRVRGFGHVKMSTQEEEATAIDALDGCELMGQTINVKMGKPFS